MILAAVAARRGRKLCRTRAVGAPFGPQAPLNVALLLPGALQRTLIILALRVLYFPLNSVQTRFAIPLAWYRVAFGIGKK